jgi:hypothetical protein
MVKELPHFVLIYRFRMLFGTLLQTDLIDVIFEWDEII